MHMLYGCTLVVPYVPTRYLSMMFRQMADYLRVSTILESSSSTYSPPPANENQQRPARFPPPPPASLISQSKRHINSPSWPTWTIQRMTAFTSPPKPCSTTTCQWEQFKKERCLSIKIFSPRFPPPFNRAPPLPQIGRASCRERV